MERNFDSDGKVITLPHITPPMSSVDSLIQFPITPERRHHESPDIIDLDAFDTDDVVYVGSARPRQRRRVGEDGRAISVTREVVHVSDNEDDEIQFIGHNPARPHPLIRRRRIFSPPPPPQIGAIPPVPRIPQRFLSLHQRPPPGLIIPDEEPLPFEVDLRPPAPVEQPLPAAAAPSHHVPSMGLGGALLAGMRRIIGPRNAPEPLERRNSWGVSGSFIMRWDPFDFAGGDEADLLDELGLFGEDNLADGGVRGQIERTFKQRDRDGKAEPDYKLEYTHPDHSSPGFTHDFNLPPSSYYHTEESGTSSSPLASSSTTRECEATLVCVTCRDPLVVGASDVGKDRSKRKLWGLRCGHLVDGKCTEKLMQPALSTPDTSGSGGRRTAFESEHLPQSSQDAVPTDFSANSIRSRLRPRRDVPGQALSIPRTVPATRSAGRPGAASASHRSNRKGKGKMKIPAVEAEYEWSCPVSGCGHVHLSLLVDGRWTMDEKKGAIAVFA